MEVNAQLETWVLPLLRGVVGLCFQNAEVEGDAALWGLNVVLLWGVHHPVSVYQQDCDRWRGGGKKVAPA